MSDLDDFLKRSNNLVKVETKKFPIGDSYPEPYRSPPKTSQLFLNTKQMRTTIKLDNEKVVEKRAILMAKTCLRTDLPPSNLTIDDEDLDIQSKIFESTRFISKSSFTFYIIYYIL